MQKACEVFLSSDFVLKPSEIANPSDCLKHHFYRVTLYQTACAYRRHTTTFEARGIELQDFWNHHVLFRRILARCNCWYRDLPLDAECNDEERESATKCSKNAKRATGA